MTTDPWALPAQYFTIIVKRHNVVNSFPGGVTGFEAKYRPAHRNGALFGLLSMSGSDVEDCLAQLDEDGLRAGEAIAVADMVQGPIIECPGLIFTCSNEHLIGGWSVNVEPKVSDLGELREHKIIAWYVDELVADHGDLSSPCGHATITVDTETLARIRSGEELEVQGPRVARVGDDAFPSIWTFNMRGPGSGLINLWRVGDDVPERLEVTAMQFGDDPTQHPAPPIFEC